VTSVVTRTITTTAEKRLWGNRGPPSTRKVLPIPAKIRA
jgi:hypothetical protein